MEHRRRWSRQQPSSSLNDETMRLFGEGVPAAAAVNVAVTLAGGLMAGWVGLLTARAVLGR